MEHNEKDTPNRGNTYNDIDIQHADSVNPNVRTVNIYGMSFSDVRTLCLDLLQSELALYRQEAAKEAEKRLNDISDKLMERLKQTEATVCQRFMEPAIQFAVNETMTEYIRSGKEELSDDLIDLMIERLQVEEHSTQQTLIDDARQILPKLSSTSVAILTLLAFTRLVMFRDRREFVEFIGKLSPLLRQLGTPHNMDIAYLEQARCGQNLSVIVSNSSFIETMKKHYAACFTHPITTDRFNQIMQELNYNTGANTLIRFELVKLFDTKEGKMQYNYSTKIDKFSIGPQKDKIVAGCNALIAQAVPYTDEEIRQFFRDIDPDWQSVFNLFERREIQLFKPSPVGLYIGARKLSRLWGQDVPIGLFYGDN